MVTPPAPAGVAENSSSPMEELDVTVVVMHVDVQVEAVRQLRIGGCLLALRSEPRIQ